MGVFTAFSAAAHSAWVHFAVEEGAGVGGAAAVVAIDQRAPVDVASVAPVEPSKESFPRTF